MRQLTSKGPAGLIASNHKSGLYKKKRREIRIPLSQSMLHRHLNIDNNSRSSRAARMFKEASATIVHLARPRAIYKTYPVSTKEKTAKLKNVELESGKVSSLLRDCPQACVFVATLGKQVDRVIEETQKSDMTMAVTLDAAASAAAELAAEYFHHTFERKLPSFTALTYRYSPGYCDWPITQQEKLFELLPDSPLGVELTDSCLMQPSKSVSGIIGIGPRNIVKRIQNACAKCTRHKCKHRRK